MPSRFPGISNISNSASRALWSPCSGCLTVSVWAKVGDQGFSGLCSTCSGFQLTSLGIGLCILSKRGTTTSSTLPWPGVSGFLSFRDGASCKRSTVSSRTVGGGSKGGLIAGLGSLVSWGSDSGVANFSCSGCGVRMLSEGSRGNGSAVHEECSSL